MARIINPALMTLEGRVRRIAALIDEMKGEEIAAIDLRGVSDFADAFVIATMRSGAHVQAVARKLRDTLAAEGVKAVNPDDSGGDGKWSLVDFSDVIVHLFDADTREYYDLESLWGDAERWQWRRLASA